MNRTRTIVTGVAIFFGLGLVTAAVLWFWLGSPSEGVDEAPITAIPLQVNTATAPAVMATATTETLYGSTDTAPTAVAAATEAAPTDAPAAGGLTVYSISTTDSNATFTINEVLRGSPKEVVGDNSEVAGEIAVDLADLSTVQIGVMQIDARSFVTDEDRRNGAIRNFILNTSQFPFITFTPTAITGLSGAASVGQPFTFQVTGDLTIRDVTKPVVFNVTAQADNEKQISGTATAAIKRSDFGLTIPSVPFVADVSDDITLSLAFVAPAK